MKMYLIFFVVYFLNLANGAPLATKQNSEADLEKSLDKFIHLYYEQYIKENVEKQLHELVNSVTTETTEENSEDIYNTMQGDQPVSNQDAQGDPAMKNYTLDEYIRTMRNRTKDNWIQLLKNKILINIGRGNTSLVQPEEPNLPPLNISHLMSGLANISLIDEDHITEKIRSFYPSCDVPQNTDQDLWKEDNILNLYFNFDYNTDDKNSNIATATLRLYRIPLENSTKTLVKNVDCDNSSSTEEKLIRVSIYWYTKSLKKRRVKRRLSDSKVISESSLWVELDVKQATKAWGKGRNLGLGVLVEDQDGNTLKADKYFKGATCTVGASTPKPIPTIIVDAVRKSNEHSRLYNLSRNDSSAAFYSDVQLLPTIDICTLEFPENQSLPLSSQISSLRINACNLKKFHEQSEKMAEKERLERLVTLPIPSNRHIRHQRQHLASKSHTENPDMNFDPRSRIVNSRILMTNEELQREFNFTSNRR